MQPFANDTKPKRECMNTVYWGKAVGIQVMHSTYSGQLRSVSCTGAPSLWEICSSVMTLRTSANGKRLINSLIRENEVGLPWCPVQSGAVCAPLFVRRSKIPGMNMENLPQCRWHQATPSTSLRGIDLPRPSSAKSEPPEDRLTVRNESPLADRWTLPPSSLLQTEERSQTWQLCSIPARLSRARQHDEGMNGRWDEDGGSILSATAAGDHSGVTYCALNLLL